MFERYCTDVVLDTTRRPRAGEENGKGIINLQLLDIVFIIMYVSI